MIYEIRFETNVSEFEYEELDNVNDIDRNFLPDWRSHIVVDAALPEGMTEAEFREYLGEIEYECISNPIELGE